MFLDQAQTERALRLSVGEGSAWALMVGLAETYFIADAVRLGASTLQGGCDRLLVAVHQSERDDQSRSCDGNPGERGQRRTPQQHAFAAPQETQGELELQLHGGSLTRTSGQRSPSTKNLLTIR